MSVIKLTSERPSGFSNDLQRVLCSMERTEKEIELMRKERERERERKRTKSYERFLLSL